MRFPLSTRNNPPSTIRSGGFDSLNARNPAAECKQNLYKNQGCPAGIGEGAVRTLPTASLIFLWFLEWDAVESVLTVISSTRPGGMSNDQTVEGSWIKRVG